MNNVFTLSDIMLKNQLMSYLKSGFTVKILALNLHQ